MFVADGNNSKNYGRVYEYIYIYPHSFITTIKILWHSWSCICILFKRLNKSQVFIIWIKRLSFDNYTRSYTVEKIYIRSRVYIAKKNIMTGFF